MPNIACPTKIRDCPCDDDPVRNLSSEAADLDYFIGMYDFATSGGGSNSEFGGDLLGDIFQQGNCFQICYSTISQEDADLCALTLAQICAMDSNDPLLGPDGDPIPAPPAGLVGGLYGNNAQSCRIRCSDYKECLPGECLTGQTFTIVVNANTIYARTQVLADRLAKELACRQARIHIICISTTSLPPCCINTAYHQQLSATGGTPFAFVDLPIGCSEDADAGDRDRFADAPYSWTIVSGSLPTGLELRACTGIIKGTPTQGGTFTFTVQATDALGNYQVQELTLCVMEITTADPLPDATIGTAYSKQLLEIPGIVADEVWTLVDGSLPPGLTLNANGTITGVPTGSVAGYLFTVQVTTEVC